MTTIPSIDMSAWIDEHSGQASPDLLRVMIKQFADAMMSAAGPTPSAGRRMARSVTIG